MKPIYTVILVTSLAGCTLGTNGKKSSNASYDFDHDVVYEQSIVGEHKYLIEVRSNQKKSFKTLAAFLMRQALDTCKTYGFTIEVLGGIEDVDDKLSRPNYIIPSLSARVQCPH